MATTIASSTPPPKPPTVLLDSPPGTLSARIKTFIVLTAAEPCPFQIVNKSGPLVPLRLNKVQRRILKAMLRQAMAGQFVRLIIPQARKMGVSTRERDSVGPTGSSN